jgi:alkanesulfonate monooxygenase SsuD/methylene tetrahydromethanopterin reductase-like flavin-dependent oxidoreductase (luciferase family)
VTDSDAEARANLRYARWQNRANRSLRRGAVIDGAVEGGPYAGEPSEADFVDTLYYGTPETVIDRFRGLAEADARFVSTWMMAGGMEHDKIMKSIRLMGDEVIPALRDVHPPADLLQELANQAPAAPVEAEDVPT